MATATQEPERCADDDEQQSHDEVEHALRGPRDAREQRRTQLEQRDAFAGHVLALVDEQLGRARRQLDLHPVPVCELDDAQHRLLVEVGFGQHELVRTLVLEQRREALERLRPSRVDTVAATSMPMPPRVARN